MQQRSHVPKFGNWDGDNVPYTAYFENARKEKAGGIRINPNDPEQNPEAFSNGISPNNGTYEQQKQKGGGGSSTSSSDTSVLKPKHQRKKSHRTKSNADTTNPSLPGPIDADDFVSIVYSINCLLPSLWTIVILFLILLFCFQDDLLGLEKRRKSELIV